MSNNFFPCLWGCTTKDNHVKEILSKYIEFNISNFYMTDSISRASETMAKCTKEILNKLA